MRTPPCFSKFPSPAYLLVPLACLLSVPEGQGANLTWDGGGLDNLVTNGLNWHPNLPPLAGDKLNFAGALRLTPDLGTSLTVARLGFASGASAFVLGGVGTYTINSSGVSNSSTAQQTVNNKINLGANQSWNAASGALVFGGNTALGNFTLTVPGAKNTTINGAISGNGKIIKSGNGVLTLSGNNAYSGGTTLSKGTLQLGQAAAVGTGSLSLGTGTISSIGGVLTINNALTLAGNTTFGGSSALIFTGNALMAAKRTLTVSSGPVTVTLGGVISGAGGLTKAGAGSLLLSGNNSYTGATNINAGTMLTGASERLPNNTAVTVAAAGTLDLKDYTETAGSLAGAGSVKVGTIPASPGLLRIGGNNANAVFSGVISGTGGVEKTGTGVWSVSGNNTLTGSTRVSGGTMNVTGSGRIAGSSGIEIAGGILQLSSTVGNRISDTARITMGALPPSKLALSGSISETVGTLKLSGASVIDFGSGSGKLNFANSSAETWTGGLSVWNWSGNVSGGGTDQLYFGNSIGGLTSLQAASVQFFSGAGTGSLGAGNRLGTGELVPVPEPAALLSAAVLLYALSSRELGRRRPAQPFA